MTALTFAKVDKATFYRFVQQQSEGRYEYVRGRIMRQQVGTRRHSRIAARFAERCRKILHESRWDVFEARGVETSVTVRYPDVVVEPSTEADESLSTQHPSLVVEVLSPTSEDRDLDVKPGEYTALETLQAYIIASQDEPACLVYLRVHNGAFPVEPLTVAGLDKVIDIPSLSLSIPMAEIYRGLFEPPASSPSASETAKQS